tara:strand:- start:391 stop:600 length:210 start_codon:yes stop_codon:yes gene_type:complete
MKEINKIINKELAHFDKSIIATPRNRKVLDEFAKANQGSSDIVLTQMAVQFGYIEALKLISLELQSKND